MSEPSTSPVEGPSVHSGVDGPPPTAEARATKTSRNRQAPSRISNTHLGALVGTGIATLLIGGALYIGLDTLGQWMAKNGSAVGGTLTVLAAFLPLTVVLVAYWAYRRDQWWKRAQWAIEAAADQENHVLSALGLVAVEHLKDNRLATKDDQALFKQLGAVISASAIDAQHPRRDNDGLGT